MLGSKILAKVEMPQGNEEENCDGPKKTSR